MRQFKFSIILSLSLSVGFIDWAIAAEVDVNSHVDKVTVFQESAEVMRRATVELSAGNSSVVFTGIPSSLNVDSLRVSGKSVGKISISGVEHKTRQLKGDLSAQAAELDIKIKNQERELLLQQTTQARLQTQKELVKAVSLDSTVPSGSDETLRPRTPQEMAQVLSFIGDAGAKLDSELHALTVKIDDLTQTLDVLRRQRSSLQPSGKQESVVAVKLDAEAPGRIELELTYQVHGARWRPTYNLHVNSSKEGSKFQLETYALVQQFTGEDWSDVDLSLSTAMAHVGLNRPSPAPKVLDLFKEILPVEAKSRSQRGVVGGALARAPMNALSESSAFAKDESEELQPIMEETAQLEKLGVYLFKVPRKSSVPSSRSQEKFKLGVSDISGTIVNIAVPALQQHVYREALVKNSTGAPLLPGQINVFSDGAFLGKQSLEFTQPDREVRLSVGLADTVVVTRKQVKRFEEDPGVVRSFRRITVGYEFKIENLSNQPQEIVILESAPLSRNEKVKVEFTKMAPASLAIDDPKRTEKEVGLLEWKLTVDPKAPSTIQYEAQVEFEAGLNVTGLDEI